jgi:hypothetical protein
MLLRSDWHRGENKHTFEHLVSFFKKLIERAPRKLSPGMIGLELDPFVWSCVKACFDKCTWENLQAKYNNPSYRWTWTHNDCHPGNFVWNPHTKNVVMIDMELVGIGQGALDLCNFLVFRTEPTFRRRHERDLVKLYHDRLIAGGKCTIDDYSFERCFQDYVFSGIARLMFHLAFATI